MMEWINEIPMLKNNKDLPYRLIVAISKKKTLLVG